MKYSTAPLIAAAVTAAILLISPAAEASPWTKDAGDYFLQLGHTYYSASEYRDGQGQIQDQADYSSNTTYVYGEVGIWEDVHLQTYLPFVDARVQQGDQSVTQRSFGDAEVALQASPLDLDVPTSVRLETRLPLYSQPDNPRAPAPGDHQVDLAAYLSAGGGLHGRDIPMYFYLDVGYMHRTEWNFDSQLPGIDFSDAVVGRVEAGYNVADTFDIAVGSSAFLPYDRDPGLDEAYITVGPSVFVPVTERFGVDLDAYTTPYSRNAGAGWAVTAGVFTVRE